MYADVVSDRRIYYICMVHPCKVRESDANQINIYCYGLQQRFIDWSLEVANASGVKYIAEPGGSIRDDLVIEECDKKGMVMAFTGMRLFHH